VWCANPNLGVLRIVDGQAERILPSGNYTSIANAGRELWLGKENGILLRATLTASGARVSARKEAQLGHPIISLFKSADGPLWIGGQNSGVAEVVNGHIAYPPNPEGFVLNTVTAIVQGRDGAMWFATANGVASLAQGRWQSYTARDGLPPGRINCIVADPSGVVWVGADQGLAYIQKGIAHVPPSTLQSLHESIFSLAVDRDDYLWILTSAHAVRVKRADLLNESRGPIFVRQFGDDDGLPPILPSRTSSSLAMDAGGRIWMSLGNTLVMADPSQLKQPSPPTQVQFQQVSADESPLRLGETVSVPPRHLRTIIRFVGLNLAGPERVRFRYRLSGLENTSVGEASYTNLAPGTYHLEVQASNIDGLWNGPPVKLALYVEPALWQALWFRASLAGVICAVGFVAYRTRLRVMKRQWNVRFQERLDERTRIARDLHDTLLQSFHGLILRFQAVRDMLPEDPEAASDALGSAIERSALAITEARDAVQALRGEDEDDDLVGALARMDREFRLEVENIHLPEVETRYRVLIEGPPRRLHPVVRDDLYRIAREAVGNAFRHAHASQIELDIRYDKGAFRLRVRDDGGGIDPQVLTSGRREGHYGLPGMRERTTSIGGQFEIWSELRRGTEIEVTIPGMIAYPRSEDAGADLYQ